LLLYNILKAIDEIPGASEGGKELSGFSDAALVSAWSLGAIEALLGSGMVDGSDGKLNPKDLTNRAMMAQMIFNLITR